MLGWEVSVVFPLSNDSLFEIGDLDTLMAYQK
jgi:hypothetical protein